MSSIQREVSPWVSCCRCCWWWRWCFCCLFQGLSCNFSLALFPILSCFLFLSFNHSRKFLSLPVTLKIRQKKLFFSPGSRWTFIITFYCLFIFLLCLLDTKKSAPRSDGCSACYTIPLTSHPDVKLVSDWVSQSDSELTFRSTAHKQMLR